MTIFIYGDSIALGLWDKMGGWVDRLKRYIQSEEVSSGIKNYHKVYNLGVDGNFTRNVIKRFQNETEARLDPKEKYVFVFATGINDTVYKDNHIFESTPEQYIHELYTVNEMAKKYSSKICFIDITPVNESLTQPIKSSLSGKCYSNKRIEEFNNALYDHCRKNNTLYVRVNERFKKAPDYTKLLLDGLHPNDEGHQIIFEEVIPIVMKFLK